MAHLPIGPPIRYWIPSEKLHSFFTAVQDFSTKRKKDEWKFLGASFGGIVAAAAPTPAPGRVMDMVASTIKLCSPSELFVWSGAIDTDYTSFLRVLGKKCTKIKNLSLFAESFRSALCLPYAAAMLEFWHADPACDDSETCQCHNCMESDEVGDGSDFSDDGSPREDVSCDQAPMFCSNGDSKELRAALESFRAVESLVVDSFELFWKGILVAPEGDKVDLREMLPSLKFYSIGSPKHIYYYDLPV